MIFKRFIAGLMSFFCMIILSACENASIGTKLEFSFNGSLGEDYISEKAIYINNSNEKITLSASLEIDVGSAVLQVVNPENGETVWNGTYNQSTDFSIELFGLEVGSEYMIRFSAEQTQSASLLITCSENLVKNKELPEKPIKTDNI